MNLLTGLVLIFLLYVFHVVIRRVRNLNDDVVSYDGKLSRISEWMAYTDHRIEEIHEKLGMLPTPEELGDVDPIEFHEMEDERRNSAVLAALPDYGISKDWRETAAYKEGSDAD
jgi:hypothetical protein